MLRYFSRYQYFNDLNFLDSWENFVRFKYKKIIYRKIPLVVFFITIVYDPYKIMMGKWRKIFIKKVSIFSVTKLIFINLVPTIRFELTTYSLRMSCSTS